MKRRRRKNIQENIDTLVASRIAHEPGKHLLSMEKANFLAGVVLADVTMAMPIGRKMKYLLEQRGPIVVKIQAANNELVDWSEANKRRQKDDDEDDNEKERKRKER